MKSILGKLSAILRRDLLTAIRHRTGFAFTGLGLLTQLAAFYFLSRAIGPGFLPGGGVSISRHRHGIGNRRRNRSDHVPERLRLGVATELRSLVLERHYVSD